MGEKGKEREKGGERENKEEGVRERGSTFSLDFSTISSSNPGEARGKVDPHCKGYAWVPGLWSFDKLREVGVFSYLVISCLKIHENGLGSCEARNGHEIRSQRKGTEYLVGTVLGQSTACSGTALCSSELVVGLKFVHVYLLACCCLERIACVIYEE